jgi:uncharacterized protein
VSENVHEIRMHDRAMSVQAPAIRWSARTSLRATLSAAIADWRWRLHQQAPVVRIAVHPQDVRHPVTLRSVKHELTRWASTGAVWRYAQL